MSINQWIQRRIRGSMFRSTALARVRLMAPFGDPRSVCPAASYASYPLATGNESEGLLALIDGKFLTFRVPYPMGYYGKGLDGRIDDTSKGWKGKGIWATFATRAPFHMEGGKGTTSKVIKFQVRPDPLSK